MACEVGRKPGGNEHVNRLSVADGQIEKAPRRGLRKELRLRLRTKGQRHLFNVVAASPELIDQRSHMQFRPALHERDLGFGNDDALDGRGDQRGR